jgi:hypothetical protein
MVFGLMIIIVSDEAAGLNDENLNGKLIYNIYLYIIKCRIFVGAHRIF